MPWIRTLVSSSIFGCPHFTAKLNEIVKRHYIGDVICFFVYRLPLTQLKYKGSERKDPLVLLSTYNSITPTV